MKEFRCDRLPIDPDFQKNRKKVGKEKGIAVWGPVHPPERLGVRGTYVAVDWDIFERCGIRLEVCPQQRASASLMDEESIRDTNKCHGCLQQTSKLVLIGSITSRVACGARGRRRLSCLASQIWSCEGFVA